MLRSKKIRTTLVPAILLFFSSIYGCKAKMSPEGAFIASITPATGLTKGGTLVTISNIDTEGVTLVEVGADCEDLKIVSETKLTCVTKLHASGEVDVNIIRTANDFQTMIKAFTFETETPSIDDVNPTSGVQAGGETITITGTGLLDVVTVKFGGVAGTNVSVSDDTELTVDTPAHAAGAVAVQVINSEGKQDTLVGAFTYDVALVPPSLTSIDVVSGSASGGVGFTLTGTVFTGATSVTFGGVAATSINVVNATTITGVTPAQAAGAVDIEVTTPGGSDELANGFTYIATAAGQDAHGGVIACLNGGLDNFVAASNDITGIWGTMGINVGVLGNTDGAANTAAIVAGDPTATTSVAHQCHDYEIDSLGNTPCEAGNTCYNDWFLGSQQQSSCLYVNRVAIGDFVGTFYWYSMQGFDPPNNANVHGFHDGSGAAHNKDVVNSARCIRAFTP